MFVPLDTRPFNPYHPFKIQAVEGLGNIYFQWRSHLTGGFRMGAHPQAVDPQVGEAGALAYERDGFLTVRGLFAPEETAEWKAKIKALLQEEGKLNNIPSGVRVWMADKLDPYFRERMRDEQVARVLTRLIGPDVEFLSVKAVYKNEQTTFGSP